MEVAAVLTFRAQHVKSSGKPYKQSSPNSIRRYPSECDIDPDAEITEVELWLTPQGVAQVTEDPIYPLQIIDLLADGSGRIAMRVPLTAALQREIQGHCPEVRVVKPESLRKAIAENFRRVAEMYAEQRASRTKKKDSEPEG